MNLGYSFLQWNRFVCSYNTYHHLFKRKAELYISPAVLKAQQEELQVHTGQNGKGPAKLFPQPPYRVVNLLAGPGELPE